MVGNTSSVSLLFQWLLRRRVCNCALTFPKTIHDAARQGDCISFNPIMNSGSLYVPALYAKHTFFLSSNKVGTVVWPHNTRRTTAGDKSLNPHDVRAIVHRRNHFDVHGKGSQAGEQKSPPCLTTAAKSHIKWTKIIQTTVTERVMAVTKPFYGDIWHHRL